jgi:nitrate reductase gamma subunit
MGFYLLTYACIAVSLAAACRLIYRHLTCPVHLRGEIYPVQHEKTDKVSYGGSYMEELNWWEKKHTGSLFNEVRYMVPEILLLRGLRKGNKRLWLVSFPFHMGLYLMIATFALLVISAAFTLCSPSVFHEGGLLRACIGSLIVASGWTGIIAGVTGSLGLFYRRLTDRELRAYATWADFFNLIFILAFFLCSLFAAAFADPFFDGAGFYILGLLTAGTFMPAYAPGQHFFGALTIVLASLLAAWIPLTHMSHMFMKYFLYHKVKWDDAPSRPGNAIETAVLRNLNYRPTWRAKHIGADGGKSWRDITSSASKETK